PCNPRPQSTAGARRTIHLLHGQIFLQGQVPALRSSLIGAGPATQEAGEISTMSNTLISTEASLFAHPIGSIVARRESPAAMRRRRRRPGASSSWAIQRLSGQARSATD